MLEHTTIPKLARSTALRYFAEVAERGSFRAASEAMHIAPSAINRQITNLEKDIGVPLFERARGRRGLQLTGAGRILQLRLRAAINELQIASDEIIALQGLQRGHVVVGVNEGLASTLIPKAIHAFRKNYPNITFSIIVERTRELAAKLGDGEIDLAVAYNFPASPELMFVKSVPLKTFLLVARDHPLAAQETLALDDLNGLDMIIPDKSLIPRQMLDLLLRGSNIRLNPVVETNSFELIPVLAEEGIANCIVNGLTMKPKYSERIVHLEIKDPSLPSNVLACCRLSGRGISAAAEAFIDLLCELFQAMEGHIPPPADAGSRPGEKAASARQRRA